jgi:hypothetical protein
MEPEPESGVPPPAVGGAASVHALLDEMEVAAVGTVLSWLRYCERFPHTNAHTNYLFRQNVSKLLVVFKRS